MAILFHRVDTLPAKLPPIVIVIIAAATAIIISLEKERNVCHLRIL